MIRIVENNDWVILAVVLLTLIYLMMLRFFQREVSITEFILQDFSEASNISVTWAIITGVFTTAYALLFSQYLPIIPKIGDEEIQILGYSFTKFGFFVVSILLFYFFKNIFSYYFYLLIGEKNKWKAFSFASQKYFFVWSLVLLVLSILHYYFLKDRVSYFEIYLIVITVFTVAKWPYYFLHRQKPLPQEWYHKILYICTIQILPELAVWKFLFL